MLSDSTQLRSVGEQTDGKEYQSKGASQRHEESGEVRHHPDVRVGHIVGHL